jgi:hypothetical protein
VPVSTGVQATNCSLIWGKSEKQMGWVGRSLFSPGTPCVDEVGDESLEAQPANILTQGLDPCNNLTVMVEPMWNGILLGGPFLEVSFLLDMGAESRAQLLERVLSALESLSVPVTFVHADQYPNIISQYAKDDPYVPGDHDLLVIGEAQFPLIVHFPEKRKALLHVHEVATRTVQVLFSFYGSSFDAPEWDQRGISPDDKSKFLDLLEELLRVFRSSLGVIGYEEDCLSLFPDRLAWPNEAYQVARFDPDKMPDTPGVIVVVWQGKYVKNKPFFTNI